VGSFIVDYILRNRNIMIEKWMMEITTKDRSTYLHTISDEIYKNTNKEFLELILKNIGKDQAALANELNTFTDRLIKLGWPLDYITEGLQAFRRVVLEIFYQDDDSTKVDTLSVLQEIDTWMDPIINQMVRNYSGSWESIVSLQKVALEELSSPVIPLLDGITVMPLIGTIDTERAKLVMENLLEGVVKNQSEVVLIDITGVPVVDTMVAHHIIKAVEAVRLIGSKTILVGIRPEIAQTIINLGINLSDFPTRSTMKKGIESALQIMNRRIVDLH
jgi:rsbT co-antagonist protein RsbR